MIIYNAVKKHTELFDKIFCFDTSDNFVVSLENDQRYKATNNNKYEGKIKIRHLPRSFKRIKRVCVKVTAFNSPKGQKESTAENSTQKESNAYS